MTAFAIVFCVFYAADVANYAYLHQRINASILNYMQDAAISMKMVWQTYHVGWIILALVLGVAAILAVVKLLYNYILSRPRPVSKRGNIIWGIAFFLLLALAIFGRIGQYPLRWSDAFDLRDDYAANLSLNPFQSFFSTLNFRHSTYEIQKVKTAYPWIASYLGVTDKKEFNYARVITGDSSAKKPNVILVICESFSAYKSSMYGNPLNTTPFFNEMCSKGIFFDHAFTPAYGTAKGVWATITGIPDVQLYKTASRNPQAVDQHSVINDFNGYQKFYFLGGSTSWANIRGLLTNNIPDLHLHEEGDYKAAKIDVWGISDKNLFLEASKVLGNQKQPFFAVIQTSDNHRPYTIPAEDSKAFKKINLPKDSLKKYGFESLDEYNAFRYTDFCYQQFMAAASKQKYYSNTIFVFVGDHGIRGDAGNIFPKAITEQGLTTEYVPLLFYAPSFIPARRLNYLASQVDILPTIAGLCKISYTNTTLGRDLLADSIKADGGKSDCAFIFDADTRRIGVIKNGLFYSYGLNNSSPEQISSILSNNKVQLTPELKKDYRQITDAFYETARYMLLNNNKQQ
ncbi:MAG: sulfatase family protein [Chitinophagaceae bacterium]|nr:sulfatase family protein [Chitinophagaceae bacterium]